MNKTTRPTTDFDSDWWKAHLREHGLRATSPRLEVVRVLACSASPMTALEVLKAADRSEAGADRVTVYRTLSSLVDAGIAHRMDPGDRVWRFGLLCTEHEHARDHAHKHHAHFVCDDCGVVRCLEEATISVSMKGGAPKQKLRIKQQDVYLHGTCERCQEGEEGEGERGG